MSENGPEDVVLSDEEIEAAQGGAGSVMTVSGDLLPEMGTSEDKDGKLI